MIAGPRFLGVAEARKVSGLNGAVVLNTGRNVDFCLDESVDWNTGSGIGITVNTVPGDMELVVYPGPTLDRTSFSAEGLNEQSAP